MYFWTIDYNNKKSYFIPSFHFNINLIFSEDEIKKFENIIENSDLVLFESEMKKQGYSKKYTKENKVKSQIRKIYNQSDIVNIVNKLNKVFKINLDTTDIEKKDIMTLTPGPGIGLLTGDIKLAMDYKLYNIEKNKKKDIEFLDSGKEFEKISSDLTDQVKKMREYAVKNPFTMKNICKNILLTKKVINSYKKVYKKHDHTKLTKKTDSHDKKLIDSRNLKWVDIIANLIHQNKSLSIVAGANHLDLLFNNNVIDLLKKKYNIVAEYKKL